MRIRTAVAASLVAAFTLAFASIASAQFYSQRNLVSDGAVPAEHLDADLVNAWGLASSATSPWWVADNGTSKSTLYTGEGVKQGLVVSVPNAPTGVVFKSTTGFDGARFIFSTEEGKILAWSGGSAAVVVADKSGTGAVYKGLAISAAGPYLYATNFHAGSVDVFDSAFQPTTVPGGFRDPTIPAGYAPFGIQNIGETIYVTYALQDPAAHDDVPGEGHGYVNAFDTAGNLLRRVASQGPLNSPWGLARAPANFGKFSNDLLVGNFGDGRIHAYDPNDSYELRGPLHSTHGRPIEIDGLWALQFGTGSTNSGPANVLFFTAGPFEEGHGLFGRLEAAEPPGRNR